VRALRPGVYLVEARDRSTRCGIGLQGAGVSRHTGAAFRGTRTWRIVLKRGTLVARCGAGPGKRVSVTTA
jgi:hypothetical protein